MRNKNITSKIPLNIICKLNHLNGLYYALRLIEDEIERNHNIDKGIFVAKNILENEIDEYQDNVLNEIVSFISFGPLDFTIQKKKYNDWLVFNLYLNDGNVNAILEQIIEDASSDIETKAFAS